MRFSFDSNILVYSVDALDRRAPLARQLLSHAVTADCVLTNQAIGEFLKVVRAKDYISLPEARQTAGDWALLFSIASTTTEHLIAASSLCERHRLQFWDSVILSVSAAAEVEYLLTEDMQDGAVLDGVQVVNPFNPANEELLDLLLTPAP